MNNINVFIFHRFDWALVQARFGPQARPNSISCWDPFRVSNEAHFSLAIRPTAHKKQTTSRLALEAQRRSPSFTRSCKPVRVHAFHAMLQPTLLPFAWFPSHPVGPSNQPFGFPAYDPLVSVPSSNSARQHVMSGPFAPWSPQVGSQSPRSSSCTIALAFQAKLQRAFLYP